MFSLLRSSRFRALPVVAAAAALSVLGLPAPAQTGTGPQAPEDIRGDERSAFEVQATGPEAVSALEDRVEVFWSNDTPIASTSRYTVTRDGTLLSVAAPDVSVYEDLNTVPGTTYNYCIGVRLADGTDSELGCTTGGRVIARPTAFQASDGSFEEYVRLTWTDHSQIEAGYNLYRSAGDALALDGSNDFVEVVDAALLEGSFTIEFWARRGSTGTPDYVVNIESPPQGDPVRRNLEIGFTADNRFSVGFGTDLLNTGAAYTDLGWHHWAVVYDAPDRRRFVYRDGELVANDVALAAFAAEGSLEFGRRRRGGNATARGHFHGALDEIRQWSRALTPSEIERVMGGLPRTGEAGLANYWPLDGVNSLAVYDVVGTRTGTLMNTTAAAWVATAVPDRYLRLGANASSYLDGLAVPGHREYAYRIAAFEDVDGDGAYTEGEDYESEQREDDGWRGTLSPPGDVAASDGQFLDRVRITWADRAAAEEGFHIYRAGTRIGTVAAGAVQFDDMTGASEQVYTYCVTSFGAGAESTQACDEGQRGGLAAPEDLVASVDEFDDRIRLTWADSTGTAQGFELFREGQPLASVGAAAREYNDLTAAQGVEYGYCIRAFSEADPQAPSYSDETCTATDGRRAIVLEPTELVVSDGEFEDRVEMEWTNPSTTAMLFLVYRDGALIEVIDFRRTTAIDRAIASDTAIEYCVAAATVVNENQQAAQATVTQVLHDLRTQDAVNEGSGLPPATAETKMEAVYSALGFDVENGKAAASAFEAGYEESDPVCATGSRSILPPTEIAATDDEFESHVRIEWADNSQVEVGYRVYRQFDTAAPELIATLSANRTTYSDYQGTPGQRFTYSVLAFDDHGVSASEADRGKRTLEPPTQFVASDGTSETTVLLSWKDNSGAELGYRVYRRLAASADAFALIDSTGKNEPAYIDVVPDALRATEFEYRVAAFDRFGESLPATANGKTFIQAPANVNASTVYDDRVVVVWVDRSAVEENYVLTRRQVGTRTVGPEQVLAANATSYLDTPPGLDTGVEYEYCVSARLTASSGAILSPPACGIGQRASDGSDGGGGGPPPGGGPVKITDGSLTSDRDNALRFGSGVAASEDGLALVGIPGADPDGRASLYETDGIGPTSTPVTAFLPAPDDGAMFGHSVAISGDYAAVGDPFAGDDARGAFAVWRRAADAWTRVTYKEGGPNVGVAIAAVDSFVVVGDDQAGTSPSRHGSATVCNVEADPTCASPVVLDNLITKAADAAFGRSVGITREADTLYAVVGAPGAQAAYVFECSLASAACGAEADWTAAREIPSPFRGGDRAFGTAVAIDGPLTIVGDPGAEGLAVWERSEAGEWNESSFFRAREPDFGASLALRGATAIVGAPGEQVGDRTNAGAVYVYNWTGSEFEDLIRYDARVANPPTAGERFGTSVDLSDEGYLVGAPPVGGGAVYYIPLGSDAPDDPIIPDEITLATPDDVRASDGTAPDRIQIRWTDEAENEAGHAIFRSVEGGDFERLAEVSADVEFYDDFAAAPGEAYTYCVAAFSLAPYSESARACDIGWRPPNGTIAGRVFSPGGAGTDDALVCLSPSVNRGLLLDGDRGHVRVPLPAASDDDAALGFTRSFTVEAWVRPRDVSGTHVIVSRDSSYTLAISNGDLQFAFVEGQDRDSVTVTAGETLTPGMWYHVAVVREEDNNVNFYLDGQHVALVPRSLLLAPGTAATSLWIGQRGDSTATFSGEIDEVRVWSTARTASEIAETRLAALTGEEESLAGYWPLDEGARRVVPDVTRAANHGTLVAGIYPTDRGAELDVCGRTASDGNFSIARIRYGETTEFDVIPTREGRAFSPGFKKITLSIESPVQNEVTFSDVTAFTVAGVVKYEDVVGGDTLSCPVPDVSIHVDKSDLPSGDNLKAGTGADGSYTVAVEPSKTAADTWFIMATGPSSAAEPHAFLPSARELEVRADSFGVDFLDQRRQFLTGNFSGGDPETCGQDIGTAEIRIYTQDGCYDRTITVDSGVDAGAFSVELPPLEYLVEVVSVNGTPPERADDVADFFARLGAVEVDLTGGDAGRNLVYRAPLLLVVDGLEPPATCEDSGLTQVDEDGAPLRALPPVAVLEEFDFVPLQIRVTEDYGDGQTCNVTEGTVTIFDAIADRVDTDSTLVIADAANQDGVIEYATFGASPNVFSGARIAGVDRSFQKPITVVAQVEGRPALMETEWALVNGFRERSATFVSASTQEFPLMILHDPPGSNSSAFIEKGRTVCNRISNMSMFGGGAGPEIDLAIGFKSDVGFSLGAHFSTEGGFGAVLKTRTIFGRENTRMNGANIETCATTTENWSTSSDPGWVGEDIHMGVALNLIFALADVVEADAQTCEVALSETLATDLDKTDPFETAYVYGTSHIEKSLIPQLENLIRLAGDAELAGSVEGQAETVRLRESVQNWTRHLALGKRLKTEGVDMKNHSFSGGTEVTVSSAADTTRVTGYESTKIYIDSENTAAFLLTVGYDNVIGVGFDIKAEWVSEDEDTEATNKTVGYVLSDNDGGDYHSVDIGEDPRYGTFVFNTVAGRSSNPCEGNTQCRDNPLILVDPPVRYNVDPSQAANFQLTLINASESNERRRYVIMAPPESNPNNLAINVAGGMLTAPREYLLDPGKAITVNMDAYASSSASDYERVGVMMYPPDEFPIWGGDPRFPFDRSDTTFFSVYFDANGANLLTAQMTEGWNWFSINREGGDVNALLNGVTAEHGDLLRSQSAESRYDSTAGWVGGLTRLAPGHGYRVRLQNPALLRIEGEAVESADPLKLAPGWTWVGYMPTKRMPVNEAMASLAGRAIEGDAIVGRKAFAQYVHDVGWVGTLRQMLPGESYAVYMEGGGELRYPAPAEGMAPADPYIHETTTRGPEWALDAGRYDAVMTVVAEIEHHGVPLRQTTTKVAAFDGDEIRGVGEVHYVEALDRHLAFMMLFGEADEQKPLVVHVYDGERDELYEAVATIDYAAQGRLGQPASPVVLELANAGAAPALADLPEVIALHPNFPNPFTTYTVIGYDLPEAADVRIVVYDILGRRVATLVDTEQPAGRHRAVFDANRVASGVYVYRLEVGGTLFSNRMVVVR